MACWLIKEEPEHYNFADLERDRTTLWDGVSNNLARQTGDPAAQRGPGAPPVDVTAERRARGKPRK